MAVEIVNFMPDAEVHRGEPIVSPARARVARDAASFFKRLNGRAVFVAITIALHVVAFVGFVNAQRQERALDPPAVIEASFVEQAPAEAQPPPPVYVPPEQVAYVLPAPEVAISVEVETIPAPPVETNAIQEPGPRALTPPLVESVEYVRTPLPVYPRESSRRKEHGTVLLRVLVDTGGRPAQVRVERSSGFERLDNSALEAVRRWLFRPHEVNGIAQSVQVLVPIEFTRRSS
jgi:periplasmic protein TonB